MPGPWAVTASFDDPNLVSCAGVVPVMRLAQQCDLHGLVRRLVHLPGDVGSNPAPTRKIAECSYTAFAGTRHEITARLIVRRVRRMNPSAPSGQDELFPTWRYHAVFTDSPFILAQAEAQHRGHAIIEQVNADLIDGPLAHLPSGHFAANGAWLTCAVIAYNLTRTAGHLAGRRHSRASGATIRREIINVAGRLAHSARKITIHLPERWPWQHNFERLFTAVHARAAPA